MIGSIATEQQKLTLTMDTRADVIIVAGKGNTLPGFGDRHTFNSTLSPSYQPTSSAKGSSNSTGTDVVSALAHRARRRGRTEP